MEPKTPVSKDENPKRGRFDDEEPKKSASKGVGQKKPPITRNTKPGQDQQLITDSTAKAYTMWHLENDRFYNPDKFTRMMNNPQPGDPVLVHNLDTNDFFYITPMLENNPQKTGMMRIDAKDTRFLEAVFIMDIEQPFTFEKLSDEEIKGLLESKFGKTKKATLISVMPILIWKQCMQSTTRFMPFYKVKMASKTVSYAPNGQKDFFPVDPKYASLIPFKSDNLTWCRGYLGSRFPFLVPLIFLNFL